MTSIEAQHAKRSRNRSPGAHPPKRNQLGRHRSGGGEQRRRDRRLSSLAVLQHRTLIAAPNDKAVFMATLPPKSHTSAGALRRLPVHCSEDGPCRVRVTEYG